MAINKTLAVPKTASNASVIVDAADTAGAGATSFLLFTAGADGDKVLEVDVVNQQTSARTTYTSGVATLFREASGSSTKYAIQSIPVAGQSLSTTVNPATYVFVFNDGGLSLAPGEKLYVSHSTANNTTNRFAVTAIAKSYTE